MLNRGALLILQLDSKCSGFQHYCYLIRNIRIGTYLGLLGEDFNNYNDLYSTIGKSVIEKLKVINPSIYNKLLRLVKSGHLDVREIAKKPTIVTLYGSSVSGISRHLSEVRGIELFTPEELFIIRLTFFKVVNIFTNDFSTTYKMFGSIVSMSSDHTVTIKDRFVVNNHYFKEVQYKGQIHSISKDVNLAFSTPVLDSFDRIKCTNSRFVNCIHRLDRLFMLEIILRGIPMLCIHDFVVIDSISLPHALSLAIKTIDNIYVNYTIIDLIISVKGTSPKFMEQQSKLLLLYKDISKEVNLKCSSSAFTLNKGLIMKDVLNLYK